jgi:cardiolipin synthase
VTPWLKGNRVRLLENGEEFFPAVFDALRAASSEIILETFILAEDRIGEELSGVLVAAARRGVRVEVTVDAWGSMGLSREFLDRLTGTGVCLHLFEEKQPRWLLRVSWFRRLHRKLVVVDGRLAFIGGINFSADHCTDFGDEAKQDFALCL